MAHNSNESNNKNTEIKQNFLSSAITDISTYIQLADTKVSIIGVTSPVRRLIRSKVLPAKSASIVWAITAVKWAVS